MVGDCTGGCWDWSKTTSDDDDGDVRSGSDDGFDDGIGGSDGGGGGGGGKDVEDSMPANAPGCNRASRWTMWVPDAVPSHILIAHHRRWWYVHATTWQR